MQWNDQLDIAYFFTRNQCHFVMYSLSIVNNVTIRSENNVTCMF